MFRDSTTRRRFLTLTGATTAVGLAGCVGGEEEAETEAEDHDDDEHDDDHDDMDDDHDDMDNGDHEHEVEHELGHPVAEITVEMMSMGGAEHFIPHVVHVEVGGTVTWELVDDLEEHDVTAYHPLYDKPLRLTDEDEHWQSPTINQQGGTFERTFDVEGVYDYFCGPHYEDDMMGRVIVGNPHADAEEHPALSPPEDELLDNEKEMIEMFNEMTMPVLEEDGH